MKPIIKWVGGKRKLLPYILDIIPKFDYFVEPFVGGGAVFFNLEPKKSFISDVNEELINFYNIVKFQPYKLFELMLKHENTKEYFYKIRAWDRSSSFLQERTKLVRASRFLFLNKTAFNGLWRVNSKYGYMNTPFAYPKKLSFPTLDILLNASKVLLNTEIVTCSFLNTEKLATKNTFYYIDPPYVPISTTASFVGYSIDGFSYKHHKQLLSFCKKIVSIGANFILSNSDCKITRELYKDFSIKTVKVKRTIGGIGSKRCSVGEILVKSF